MNITIFQQAPDLGGAEFFMVNLVKEWENRGDAITVFTNYPPLKSLFSRAGARVGHLPFRLDIMGNRRGLLKTVFLLPFAIVWYAVVIARRRKAIDTIFVCGYTEKLLVTFIAKLFGVTVVWLEYPPLEPLLKRNLGIPKYLYLLLAQQPYRIIVISQHSKKSLIEETGIDPRRLALVYPGVPAPSQRERERSAKRGMLWKKKLGINGKPVIGNLSRVACEKNQEALLNALLQIRQEIPDAVLVIVGRGPDTMRLKNLASALHIQESVRFLGFVENRNDALSMMDVFVFPASWELEGFGLVLAEAMVMQRAIVAVGSGPTLEILKHNRTGLLVPANDTQHLARAIVRLMRDRELAQRLARHAMRSARLRFAIGLSAGRMHVILEEAVHGYAGNR